MTAFSRSVFDSRIDVWAFSVRDGVLLDSSGTRYFSISTIERQFRFSRIIGNIVNRENYVIVSFRP